MTYAEMAHTIGQTASALRLLQQQTDPGSPWVDEQRYEIRADALDLLNEAAIDLYALAGMESADVVASNGHKVAR